MHYILDYHLTQRNHKSKNANIKIDLLKQELRTQRTDLLIAYSHHLGLTDRLDLLAQIIEGLEENKQFCTISHEQIIPPTSRV